MSSNADSASNNDDGSAPAGQTLAIDVGNSMVKLGAMSGGKADETAVVDCGEMDRLGEAVASIWSALDAGEDRPVVVSSVAPETLERVRTVVGDQTGRELIVIRDQIDLPIPVAVDNPESVGTDRVCAAAAAHAKLKQACVVADFGTAIKIDLVGDDGVFMGGTILPGLRMSAESLEANTAALPLIEIREPEHAWGRSTSEAINNGVFFGAVGALREIAERYSSHAGKWLPLVITGGAAELIAKYAEFVDRVVPDLTLRGIDLAYQRAIDRQDD